MSEKTGQEGTGEPPRRKSHGSLLLLTIPLTLLAITWIIHRTYTAHSSYLNRDFMSLYAGGYALLEGLDPYDEAVWVPLRQQLGSRWMPDPRAPFPLWTSLIMVPFALLSMEWAVAAWLTVSLALILVSVHLLLSLRPSPALAPVTLLGVIVAAFFTRGGLASFNNGQLTAVLLAVLALFLFLESRGHAFAAGAAFSLVALKPNPFLLFVPAVLLWLLLRRRFDILLGAVATGLGLLAVTWVLHPGWLFEWMAVRDKSQAAIATPTVWGLAYEFAPAVWVVLGIALTLFITVITGWYLYTRPYVTLPAATGLALSASLAVTPYAWALRATFVTRSIAAHGNYLSTPAGRFAIVFRSRLFRSLVDARSRHTTGQRRSGVSRPSLERYGPPGGY